MSRKTTLTFQTYYNDAKFFYAKGNDTELGVIRKTPFGVEASMFIGERGAWTQEIPVFEGGYTKDCESFLRKLFADKQKLVDVIEAYRAEQNAQLDALTNRLTN